VIIYECFVCGEVTEAKTCDRCRNRIHGMLADLPEQFVYLSMSRQRDRGGSDGRSSRRLHAPLPCRDDVLNMLGPAARQSVTDGVDQVGSTPFLEVLWSWCEAVADERGLRPVRKHVTAMTARLTTHLTWICEQPWVTDFESEIQELLKTVRAITRTQPRRVPLPVTCPSCSMLTLVREDHSGWAAECLNCPAVKLDARDYGELVRVATQTLEAVANA